MTVDIPHELVGGRQLLLGLKGVRQVGEFRVADNTSDVREVFLQVVVCPRVPAGGDFPSVVPLELRIALPYPLGRIDVFPRNPKAEGAPHPRITGFPHQDAETGKLCLRPESEASLSTEDRLAQSVRWSVEWLEDAAAGRLAVDGDPYELPDFSQHDTECKCPEPFYFSETAASWAKWQPWAGGFGFVTLLRAPDCSGYFARSYTSDVNDVIYRVEWGSIAEGGTEYKGLWVLLKDECCFERKRPPHTWGELIEVLKGSGLGLESVLLLAERNGLCQQEAFPLLVGFFVPQRYGDPPAEVHWQGLCVPGWGKLKVRGFRNSRRLQQALCIGPLSRDMKAVWMKSWNACEQRLRARGTVAPELRDAQVILVGCGALGSHVAEYLVRSGVRHITLVDGDSLEAGNLARHVCTLEDVNPGESKATVLSRRLSAISPHATCKPCPHRLPLAGKLHEEFLQQIEESDIVLDFSTSDQALCYLDQACRRHGKLLISGYISFGAKSFCMFSNSAEQTAGQTERELLSKVERQGSCDALFPAPSAEECILEGAGCWHPTFPATEYQVAGWAAFAVAQIEAHLPDANAKAFGVVARTKEDCDAGAIEIVHRV